VTKTSKGIRSYQSPVREQLGAVLLADIDHAVEGPGVDERELEGREGMRNGGNTQEMTWRVYHRTCIV
jgi:hypothetical protein